MKWVNEDDSNHEILFVNQGIVDGYTPDPEDADREVV